MREAIERVIEALGDEHQHQWDMERKAPSIETKWYRQGAQDGLLFAIKKLKDVVAHERTHDMGSNRRQANIPQESDQA